MDQPARLQVWVLFPGYTVPLVVSPGPGNTVLATAGGRFGVQGTLPFWMGFEAANVALCLLYGIGLGRVLQGLPTLHQVLRWGSGMFSQTAQLTAAFLDSERALRIQGWTFGACMLAVAAQVAFA